MSRRTTVRPTSEGAADGATACLVGSSFARAMTSLLPPAENGTTILMVFGSGACAPTVGTRTSAAASMAAARTIESMKNPA